MSKLEPISDKAFNMIADRAFRESYRQYERDTQFDKSKIVSDEDFFVFVEKKIEAMRAHNERYTTALIKGLIDFYSSRE